MKKTAKFLSLVLALIIAMSAFSISGFAVATELEAGNSKETAVNIPEFGIEYVSELSEAGEVDWFVFKTLPDDAYYSYTLKNYNMPYHNYGEVGNDMISPNIFIYDAFLKEVAYSYNNSYRNFKLDPNTEYFIKILNGDKNSVGNYSIIIDYRYDSVPNEKSDACELLLNESSINTFDGWYDVDWFKFTTTKSGEYVFKLKNHDLNGYQDNYAYGATDLSPNIVVYDKFDLTLGSSNNNTSFSINLEENTEYYIKMFMGSSHNKQVGTYEIFVTSPDYSANKLTSISLASAPTKTEYLVGETIDVNGLSVEAAYSDGTKKNVEGYSITGFDSSTTGTKTVTVSYTENGVTCECTFDVTVSEPAPDIDLDLVEFNGHTYALIDINMSWQEAKEYCESLGGHLATISSQEENDFLYQYCVSLGKKSAFFGLSDAESEGNWKWVTGEPLEYTNWASGEPSKQNTSEDYGMFYYKYTNGKWNDGDSSYVISGTGGQTAGYLCEWENDSGSEAICLSGIVVENEPDKTSYKVGESFNKSGLVVSAQYSDGSSKVVTDYTISGFDSSTAGTKTVTVSYTEDGITKTSKFNVNVVAEKKLIAISVASMPTKTTYQVGEDFDASGLIVNTFYDDGTSAFVTDYTVSGFDSETAGTKTVVVSYTDKDITKSCTFEVTVEEPEDSGNFFTDLINWLMNFFMSIIEFFTALLGG